jgi:uncharacterized membrane protein YhaH (DUF805 family)
MQSQSRVKLMLKLQWSDIFPSASGRMGRKDYLASLFKLAMAYFLGVKIVSVLLAIAIRRSGYGEAANPFAATQAAALMQTILFWPVLTLVSRRMEDVKQSVRERYWVWRFTFPAALTLLVGANALAALGLGGFVNAELVTTLSPLIPIVLITAGFLTPEPMGSAMPKLDAAPVAAPAIAKLARTIAAKPASAPELAPAAPRTYQREASRPAVFAKAAHASSGAVQRTRSLPEQGRVRTGWFN